MKIHLLKNQILYFKDLYSKKIIQNNLDISKKQLSPYDNQFSNKNLLGRISILNNLLETEDCNLQTKIFDNYNLYNKQLELLKVNVLNNEDENINLFYFINGCCSVLLLLMTVPENSLSACPVNKDILLSDSLSNLNKDLEEAVNNKNKFKIKNLRKDIKITTELYNLNLEVIKNENKIEV